MPVSLETLKCSPTIEKVVVDSLESSLYQCSVVMAGEEFLVVDPRGQPLRSSCVVKMQDLFDGLPVKAMVLRQRSAYDEMIGQPLRCGENTLEVPLGYPFPMEE